MKNYILRTGGDPVLTEACEPVTEFPVDPLLLDTMKEICTSHGGVGLAAPQVGETLQVILINTGSAQQFIVNPKISPIRTRGTAVKKEGCLSYPGRSARVARFKKILVTGKTVEGEPFTATYSGLNARVVQHEVDHLAGKCIVGK